jgi:hypothetical protein
LDELRGREFELVFRLGCLIAAAPLAKSSDRLDREFFFSLKANTRTGREAEDVFGFDITPRRRILSLRGTGAESKHQNRS